MIADRTLGGNKLTVDADSTDVFIESGSTTNTAWESTTNNTFIKVTSVSALLGWAVTANVGGTFVA